MSAVGYHCLLWRRLPRHIHSTKELFRKSLSQAPLHYAGECVRSFCVPVPAYLCLLCNQPSFPFFIFSPSSAKFIQRHCIYQCSDRAFHFPDTIIFKEICSPYRVLSSRQSSWRIIKALDSRRPANHLLPPPHYSIGFENFKDTAHSKAILDQPILATRSSCLDEHS